ncbi:MAG: peptide-methionine (S)-S-oxide reductase MsrA [Chthoniobacterales bacterium]|nr:peptide-methionine (S)-S-oxide reductase MsrA [Chthoniobacterales bacterium]
MNGSLRRFPSASWLPLAAFSIVLCALLFNGIAAAQDAKAEKAVFGAGCFWCVEAFFEQQPGVIDVISGYAGGDESNPTYKQVGAGQTAHAEAVQITFDPAKTSYEKLLAFFWNTHDPTDGRGVAPDFGRQYRSIIVPLNEEQRAVAEKSKEDAHQQLGKPIATEIAPIGKTFYPAEEYHQDYVHKNPGDGYVKAIAIPKLKKLGLRIPG